MAPRTRDSERRAGRELRRAVPRAAHAAWGPSASRPDPIGLLEAQNAHRLPDLVPVRWGRMLESPYAFLRGAAVVMACDLATTASTGVVVQLSGDAHLANFGAFLSPERHLLFDLNDFDETTPGPWEWDVKRLATSAVVAVRGAGLSKHDESDVARAAVCSYRTRMGEYAKLGELDVWYARVDAAAASRALAQGRGDAVTTTIAKAKQQTSRAELPGLTELTTAGARRIVDHPPLVTHTGVEQHVDALTSMLERYVASLDDERRVLVGRFTLADIARKVVGVGSVGTRCYIALFMSEFDDPLVLQVKEAESCALAPYVASVTHAGGWRHPRGAPAAGGGARPDEPEGRRVVDGQRLMQAASDIFLGWASGGGVDYYVRQLRDVKGTVNTSALDHRGFVEWAELCGWALARAHARTGAAVRIAGYCGTGDALDGALVEFAGRYADQTERDHALLEQAVRSGRIEAVTGV